MSRFFFVGLTALTLAHSTLVRADESAKMTPVVQNAQSDQLLALAPKPYRCDCAPRPSCSGSIVTPGIAFCAVYSTSGSGCCCRWYCGN